MCLCELFSHKVPHLLNHMDADGQLAFNANNRATSCSDVFKPGGEKKKLCSRSSLSCVHVNTHPVQTCFMMSEPEREVQLSVISRTT